METSSDSCLYEVDGAALLSKLLALTGVPLAYTTTGWILTVPCDSCFMMVICAASPAAASAGMC